eukprot:gene4910-12663_t
MAAGAKTILQPVQSLTPSHTKLGRGLPAPTHYQNGGHAHPGGGMRVNWAAGTVTATKPAIALCNPIHNENEMYVIKAKYEAKYENDVAYEPNLLSFLREWMVWLQEDEKDEFERLVRNRNEHRRVAHKHCMKRMMTNVDVFA